MCAVLTAVLAALALLGGAPAALAGGDPKPVSFIADVAPILNANCVQCHRAGEIAPFPLTQPGSLN